MKRSRTGRSLFSGLFVLAAGTLLTLGFAAAARLLAPAPPAVDPAPLHLRFHVRPVLRGTARSGNALASYRRAALDYLAGEGELLAAALEDGRRPLPAESDSWIGVNVQVVRALHEGTQCFGAAPLPDPTPEAGLGPELGALLVEGALREADEGRIREAFRVLLDAARFGQDLARGGGFGHRLFGLRVEFGALRWLVDLLGREPVDGETLRLLARELALLDAGRHPLHETFAAEVALALTERRDARRTGPESTGGLLPEEEVLRTAVVEAAGMIRPDDRLDPARGPALARALGPDPTGILERCGEDMAFTAGLERRVEALLRVAAAATALRAHRLARGALPSALAALGRAIRPDPLADPPGERAFAYHIEGGAARLVSAGPDGDDDGGAALPWTWYGQSDGDWTFVFQEVP